MQIGKLKIVLVLLCCVALAFEVWHLRGRGTSGQQQTTQAAPKHKPNFVLLPATEIATYAGRIASPKPRMENWEPTVADIDDLEANLAQIPALSSKEPDVSPHIDDPNQYFRQYLAVVVNGRKTIFVNALCNIQPGQDWRKRLIILSDGGKCFWNAIYDPATQKFSDLAVNGRA
jgi:hypothetical protein